MKKLVLITAMIFSSLSIAVAQHGMGYNSGSHYGGNVGYNSGADVGPPAMHQEQFRRALDQIRYQSFDDGRLSVARQVARNNNLRSRQVMRIMKQFSFESTRLKFAKFAYRSGSVVDAHNYHIVNEAFSFSSSVRKLDQFISSVGRPAQSVGGSCGTGVSTYQSGTLTVSGGVVPSGGYHNSGTVGYNSGSHGGGYYSGSHGGMNPAPAHHAAAGFSTQEFNCLINDLRQICFDSERLAVAKRKVCTRSLKSCEVVRIMHLFSFESNKLDFAKAAYLQTCDKQNYYLVNDAFSFSSSVRNLECYIRSL